MEFIADVGFDPVLISHTIIGGFVFVAGFDHIVFVGRTGAFIIRKGI